jgi:hypothetical protein
MPCKTSRRHSERIVRRPEEESVRQSSYSRRMRPGPQEAQRASRVPVRFRRVAYEQGALDRGSARIECGPGSPGGANP